MDIKEEQLNLQYVIGEELKLGFHKCGPRYDSEKNRLIFGERSNTLFGYAALFAKNPNDHISPTEESIASRGMFAIFEQILKEKGKVVWVDLGCANAIALRQGKRHFEKEGFGIDNLVTIGYDILPFDKFEYEFRRMEHPTGYKDNDWDSKFNPNFIEADIMDVIFPEAPDIVTCVGVTQWSRDPLAIFANAAKQLPKGAYLGFSGMDCCQIKEGWDPYTNPVIDPAIGPVPGFETIKLREEYDPHIMSLRRTSDQVENNDFTFEFTNPKPIHPMNCEGHRPKPQRHFVTYYTKPEC